MKPHWLRTVISVNRRARSLYRRMIADRQPGGPMTWDARAIPSLQTVVDACKKANRETLQYYFHDKTK